MAWEEATFLPLEGQAEASSLYAELGTHLRASQDEIRQQFRKLALAHHPDRAGGSSERFQRIVDAFEVLRDPQRRASYDTSLVQLLDMQEYLDRFSELCCTVQGLSLPTRASAACQPQQQPRGLTPPRCHAHAHGQQALRAVARPPLLSRA